MPINDLLNVPRTAEDWQSYSFNLRDAITQLQQKIYNDSNGATVLFQYQLDPINFQEVNDWLDRVEQSINDINAYLGLQEVDLESVDLSNQAQLQSWIYNLYQEIYSAAQALQI